MNDKIEFDNDYELYSLVHFALKSKLKELATNNYEYLTADDIWQYLSTTKWQKKQKLILCDVVDDILNCDNQSIDIFIKEKMKKQKEETLIEELNLI